MSHRKQRRTFPEMTKPRFSPWGCIVALWHASKVLGVDPTFDVPIVNVTVVAGQTAVLPCSIDYLNKFKVAWLDHNSIPLTYEDRRVVDDPRFSVVRPYPKEWNLQVRDVRWEDQGQYRCTINTNPVKNKVIMLHVKVPPTILDYLSSEDLTVQEGDTVVLECNVTGVPQPEVTWFRRPAASKNMDRERIETNGELIVIGNVSRYCDDIYICVANNGVPPAVSRQMRVTVEFAPEIQLQNRRMGQVRGRETILECTITAFPLAQTAWEKEGRRLGNSNRHRIESYDEGDHTTTLSLRISDIEQEDYGEYKCIAENRLGIEYQTMNLYQYTEPDDRAKTTTTTTQLLPMVLRSRRLTEYPVYSIPVDTFPRIPDIRSYTQRPHKLPNSINRNVPFSERSRNESQHNSHVMAFSIWLPLYIVCSAFSQLTCRK